ncbi:MULTISPECIES: flavodoxin [Saccharibacillus]|uniref:Flavodoxin n=1 Tax=Saccharibacillus brassicae TaxID=2583377 RepID=A0A4Y6URP2_SACBS|nr:MULTISPECIES: flavodoxin [Saccharibacillus]MWJ31710.1 flavodoxin [Saccharibacillus sp. WB 17]QDH19430.1 flavodoxin [Saccharibacillus brassicae]
MSKLLLIYASMTGNTEEMSELITNGIEQAGGEVTVKLVEDCSADLLLDYDGIMLGAYTWGDGELPDEYLDFYEELDEVDLAGKKAAVFGSGDTVYEQFAKAVDLLQDKLAERGAQMVLEPLKLELNPSGDEREACRAFGKTFAGSAVGV